MKNIIFSFFLLNSFISGSLFAEPFVVYEYSENSSNNSKSQNFLMKMKITVLTIKLKRMTVYLVF